MIDRMDPPPILPLPDRPPDDLDQLLRSYFQSELPSPWPALRALTQPGSPADLPGSPVGRRRWLAFRRRLAVAASVAALLIGYLLLAQAFPSSVSKAPSALDQENHFGEKFKVPRADPHRFLPPGQEVDVPNGGRARIVEEPRPNNGIHIQVELLPDSATHPRR
jgi:hypothetical protein